MGTFDKVPLTGGKSYYNKQEGDWWQQANLPERLDDDYSEMESTFMERQTPGGVKYTSVPGQYHPPSVRRTRRDDLDWDSSSALRRTILGTSFSLPRVCLVLPLLSLILGLIFSLLPLPPVFLGGE
jgi:hypothetical protein